MCKKTEECEVATIEETWNISASSQFPGFAVYVEAWTQKFTNSFFKISWLKKSFPKNSFEKLLAEATIILSTLNASDDES